MFCCCIFCWFLLEPYKWKKCFAVVRCFTSIPHYGTKWRRLCWISKKPYLVTTSIVVKNLISSWQLGFRQGHSTNHALLTMSEDIIRGLNDRKFTIAVFLDSEKAFNTVWIKGLIWKMKFKFNMDDNLCFLIYNYLRNRSFKVTVNDKISSPFRMCEGTPQGSIISPMLYTIFTLDIPRW